MTSYRWQYRDGAFDLERKALVMGVLNVTPDSFSDGGAYLAADRAVERGLEMLAEGADIIDVGGESSRPGSTPVPAAEEMERVIPVIERLAGAAAHAVISVDTTKSEVAGAALRAGAHIINDISGLTFDPRMAGVVCNYQAGLVIMHMQGSPGTMQQNPRYDDVVAEVGGFLRRQVEVAVGAGIPPACMVVDPGIGFGKTVDHNLSLLCHLDRLEAIAGRPLLVGASRKRFLGAITGREPGDRLAGSLTAAAYAIMRGARIIRVHDIKESCDIACIMDKLKQQQVLDG